MSKKIVTSGKRKTAIARATLSDGKGEVLVNGQDINTINPEVIRLKILTPLLIAEDISKKVKVNVRVTGGGVSSRAEACALAIARALVKHTKKLEKKFLDYDRQLLVADVRRKEVTKPNRHGKARSKRQKSYR